MNCPCDLQSREECDLCRDEDSMKRGEEKMNDGSVINNIQKMIFDAKMNYMQGNDVFEDLEKMEKYIIDELTKNESLGKMSKSEVEF